MNGEKSMWQAFKDVLKYVVIPLGLLSAWIISFLEQRQKYENQLARKDADARIRDTQVKLKEAANAADQAETDFLTSRDAYLRANSASPDPKLPGRD